MSKLIVLLVVGVFLILVAAIIAVVPRVSDCTSKVIWTSVAGVCADANSGTTRVLGLGSHHDEVLIGTPSSVRVVDEYLFISLGACRQAAVTGKGLIRRDLPFEVRDVKYVVQGWVFGSVSEEGMESIIRFSVETGEIVRVSVTLKIFERNHQCGPQ